MNDRFKFRAWIGKERALIGYGARYLYFNAIGGISDSFLKKEGFDEIEQCTGLKDKNGKLIYEGDILKITDQMIDYIVEVYWNKGMFCYDITPNSANLVFCDLTDNETTVEVIGNIHDTIIFKYFEKNNAD